MPQYTWRASAAAALLMTLLPISVSAQQAPQHTATYTEAQLNDFARATLELGEVHRGLGSNPSDAQRQEASAAARAILQRHNLDVATFNAIASQASRDEALAQRIRAMREQASE